MYCCMTITMTNDVHTHGQMTNRATGIEKVPHADTGMTDMPHYVTGIKRVPHADTGTTDMPNYVTGIKKVPHTDTGTCKYVSNYRKTARVITIHHEYNQLWIKIESIKYKIST